MKGLIVLSVSLSRLRTLFTAFLIAVVIAACGGNGGSAGSANNDSSEAPGDTGQVDSIDDPQNDGLSVEEQALVTDLMERASNEGVLYDYNEMTPVFGEVDGNRALYFLNENKNYKGGSPVAIISEETGEIIRIEHTR